MINYIYIFIIFLSHIKCLGTNSTLHEFEQDKEEILFESPLKGVFIGKENHNKTIDLRKDYKELNQFRIDEHIESFIIYFSQEFESELEIYISKLQKAKKTTDYVLSKPYMTALFVQSDTFRNIVARLENRMGANIPAYNTVHNFFIRPLVDLSTNIIDLETQGVIFTKAMKHSAKVIMSINTFSELVRTVVNIGGCLKSYNYLDSDKITIEELNLKINLVCRPGLASYFALKVAFALNYNPIIRPLLEAYDTVHFATYGNIREFQECIKNQDGVQICDPNSTSVYFYYNDKNGKRKYDWLKAWPDKNLSYFQLFGFWVWQENEQVFLAPEEELKYVLDLVKKQITEEQGDLSSVEIKVADSSYSIKGYPIFFSSNLKNKNLIKTESKDIIIKNKYKIKVPGIWFLDENGKTVFMVREDSYKAGLMTLPQIHREEKHNAPPPTPAHPSSTISTGEIIYFGTNQLLEYENIDIKTTWSFLSPLSWIDSKYKVLIVKDFPSIEEYYSRYYVKNWSTERKLGIFLRSLGVIFSLVPHLK